MVSAGYKKWSQTHGIYGFAGGFDDCGIPADTVGVQQNGSKYKPATISFNCPEGEDIANQIYCTIDVTCPEHCPVVRKKLDNLVGFTCWKLDTKWSETKANFEQITEDRLIFSWQEWPRKHHPMDGTYKMKRLQKMANKGCKAKKTKNGGNGKY